MGGKLFRRRRLWRGGLRLRREVRRGEVRGRRLRRGHRLVRHRRGLRAEGEVVAVGRVGSAVEVGIGVRGGREGGWDERESDGSSKRSFVCISSQRSRRAWCIAMMVSPCHSVQSGDPSFSLTPSPTRPSRSMCSPPILSKRIVKLQQLIQPSNPMIRAIPRAHASTPARRAHHTRHPAHPVPHPR